MFAFKQNIALRNKIFRVAIMSTQNEAVGECIALGSKQYWAMAKQDQE
jgi:hypothetical protein